MSAGEPVMCVQVCVCTCTHTHTLSVVQYPVDVNDCEEVLTGLTYVCLMACEVNFGVLNVAIRQPSSFLSGRRRKNEKWKRGSYF